MAQVPYQPYSTATPDSPGEQLRVSPPPAAFGVNVGQALQQLGSTTEQVGGELFQRAMGLQELKNENSAREAQIGFDEQMGLLQAKFDALEGKAKVDALPGHIQAIKDLRTQIRSTLPTAFAQRNFDRDTMPYTGRYIFSSAVQAGQADKQYTLGTANNLYEIASKQWADPTSDSEFADKWKDISAALETENHIRQDGMDESRQMKALSKLWSGRIDALARTDPIRAQKMFDDLPKGTLTQDDSLRTLEHVQSQNHSIGSRVAADKVLGDMLRDPKHPDRPMQEYLDEGDRLAEQIAPKDPGMKDWIRGRITTLYTQHNIATREFKYQNINTIDGALLGEEGGKIPTTPEELNALGPKYQQAWNNLDKVSKIQALSKMAKMSKGDVQWGIEGARRYQTLKGMAIDDPAGFLDVDVIGEGKLPFSARRELSNLQQRIITHSREDPRVQKTMTNLGNLIPQAILQDKDARQQYMGALSDQLRDFQVEMKRAPNFEEQKLINTRLLQEQITQKGWIWDTKGPLYNLPVPQSDIDKQREKLKDSGLEVSDQQIRRELIRQYYQRNYGSKPKSSTPLGPGEDIMPQ